MTDPTPSAEVLSLDIRDVSLCFGRLRAVDRVSLALAPGEVVAVLGESGCGKSSLLRLAAGLEAPDSGEIRIDGRVVAGAGRMLPPEDRGRGLGLMFQDHALFPHLDVRDNVRFGLHRLPRARALEVALARLAEVGLADRARDYPHVLSGGEAQRVALARALAPEPRLLLLDEPFCSLDPGTRAQVRGQTLALLRARGTTALLVTHDPAEAMEFADRIVLMRAGRVVQAGRAEEIYRRPVSPFAAHALGDVIEVAGRAGGGRVETALGTLPWDGPARPVRVCLRPEAIRIVPAGTGASARVLASTFAGACTRLRLAVDGLDAPLALATSGGGANAGEAVGLCLDPDGAHVYPAGDA